MAFDAVTAGSRSTMIGVSLLRSTEPGDGAGASAFRRIYTVGFRHI
jgi:hypothetical protein